MQAEETTINLRIDLDRIESQRFKKLQSKLGIINRTDVMRLALKEQYDKYGITKEAC